MARFSVDPSVRRAMHTLGATQIIAWGTIYYLPTLLGPILAAEKGWSRSASFGAFSAALIINALMAGRVGRRIDGTGGRGLMAAGSGLAALGLAVLAMAPNFIFYALGWGILGVAMGLCLYEPAFASLVALGGTAARPAITALTLYGGLASTIFWPLGLTIEGEVGWRGLCWVYAALNLLICLPLHLWGLRPRGPLTSQRITAPTVRSPLTGPQTRLLILYGAAFVLLAYSNAALSAHMIEALTALGLGETAAVTAGALRGVGQVASRVLEFGLGGAASALAVSMAAAGLAPLAFLLPWLGLGTAGAFAFAVVQGASNGLVTIAKGAVPLAIVGPERYGEVAGRLTGPVLTAAACAPALHAVTIDLIGQRSGLGVLAGLTVISALLITGLVIARPRVPAP